MCLGVEDHSLLLGEVLAELGNTRVEPVCAL